MHTVQSKREYPDGAKCSTAVTLRAYEVYCNIYGPQEAMITGTCRGGFSAGEIIVFLYAHSFPKEDWRKREQEAFRGMEAVMTDPERIAALEHTRSCPALTPGSEYECTCGLDWRIKLQTEQEMHNAWRKRAEQSERELAAANALIEELRGASQPFIDDDNIDSHSSDCKCSWCKLRAALSATPTAALERHDAQVRAQALRDKADAYEQDEYFMCHSHSAQEIVAGLRARAFSFSAAVFSSTTACLQLRERHRPECTCRPVAPARRHCPWPLPSTATQLRRPSRWHCWPSSCRGAGSCFRCRVVPA